MERERGRKVAGPVEVVLATANPGKASEFGRLLSPWLAVRLLPKGVRLPEETGSTFAQNARLKAQAVFRALDGRQPVLADDSGLEVEALNGRPGVHSARFAGERATDRDNVERLLAELRGVSGRRARFVCALCLILPGRDENAGDKAWPLSGEGSPEPLEFSVEGRLPGRITEEPRGGGGFGYDPVFMPDGWRETLGEVSAERKDAVSHRAAAVRALVDALSRKGIVVSAPDADFAGGAGEGWPASGEEQE